ncbi:MAG TPA: serine/threonine-protein kinase [Nannocystaceae bacterium]|nr:serine/threonine-protein kinase [Nannocystaceae bacterium]
MGGESITRPAAVLPESPPSASAPFVPATTRQPGTQLGRFVVLDVLGKGGMGVVYLAYDPELERKVALKLVRAQRSDHGPTNAQARLLREAQALAQLRHPNVVGVYDVGTLDDEVFIAMEYVPGRTLRQWIDQTNPDWREILRVMIGAGRGLAAAHARGLVHRDVKPANIVVEDGGNARVLDFGLARTRQRDDDDTPSLEAATPSGKLREALTQAGAVMGTPAYMAPEQHTGDAIGPATDQYGFCVTLFEALYGRHPLPGRNAAELAQAAFAARFLSPPRRTKVPRRVHRLMLRGLAPSAADRYADMNALCDALADDPEAARRRWLGGGLAAAAVATAAIVSYRAWAEGPGPCDAAQALGDHWNDARRGELAAALTAVDRPFVATTAARVETIVDAWAARWTAQWREACEATHVRHEQTMAVLALREACLERRASELDALLGVLATADVDVVAEAVEATRELGDPQSCADTVALGSSAPLPDDPQSRAALSELQAQIDRARALRAANRFDEGLAIAEPLAQRVAALGHLPTEADAMLALGELQAGAGAPNEALASYERAVWAAEAGRVDAVAARGWLAILGVTGVTLSRHDDAERAAVRADAAILRAGEDPRSRASWHHSLASLAEDRGDFARAREHFEQALAIREETLAPDDADIAGTEMGLGNVLHELGDSEGARVHYQRALDIFERGLGPDHPDLGLAMSNLANLDYGLGRFDDALAGYRATLELWERVLGPDHPDNAIILNNLGNVVADLGRADEAITYYQRALALWEDAYGPDHPNVASAYGNLGLMYRDAGRLGDAQLAHERELAIRQKVHPEGHDSVAKALGNLAMLASTEGRLDDALALHGRALTMRKSLREVDPASIAFSEAGIGTVLRKLGRDAEALERFEAARATWAKQLGDDHPLVAQARLDIGRSLYALGRTDEALPHLEHAHAVRTARAQPEGLRGETAFALALALWDQGKERPRALRLAREAETLAASTRNGDAALLVDVKAWLAKR